MNRTKRATALRYLATEAVHEGEAMNDEMERLEARRLAYQLMTAANALMRSQDQRTVEVAAAWHHTGTERIVSWAMRRVTDLSIDEVLHG